MRVPKKMIVFMGLAAFAVMGGAAVKPGKPADTPYKNLKVLPATITSKQLLRLMTDVFQDDLGVACNFCHAENKDTHKPDYASDEKPEKEIARKMIQMTNDINRQYFGLGNTIEGDYMVAVTCGTCHNGQPHPEAQ